MWMVDLKDVDCGSGPGKWALEVDEECGGKMWRKKEEVGGDDRVQIVLETGFEGDPSEVSPSFREV